MTHHLRPGSSPVPPDWEALARYHAGECPADEVRLVATWLAAHPQDAALLSALEGAVERAVDAERQADVAVEAIDVEAALRAVKARRDGEARPPATVHPLRPQATPRRAPRRGHLWLGAGGLAAAAALALLLRGDSGVETSDPTAAGAPAATDPRLALPGRTIETAVGVRDSLRLPDGTRVVLAPGSRLTVSSTFGDAGREVTLAGQAHFTATHDEARPFTVRANGVLVRDLGTVFTVRTDGVGGGIAVAVTEGRVAMDAPAPGGDTAVVLNAGDRAERGETGAVRVERGVVAAADVAWATSGTLVYRAAPLSRVAADLRRWYGITLRVDDARLASRRLTATFTDEPIDQVLQVIALALGATVERDGDTAVLRPAGGAPR